MLQKEKRKSEERFEDYFIWPDKTKEVSHCFLFRTKVLFLILYVQMFSFFYFVQRYSF